ncbi:hypothetical protein LWM68_09290 [Niabella sp. W65]|nr:hypothetical protein [Niabella sp. W65]MCH7362944.1 hypothetical protein [Niabella sp. W65]
MLLPDGVNLSNLTPQIQVENNIQVSPASGVPQNFTGPVSYTLTSGNTTATYRVTVISNSVNEYAFLGLAATRDAIADPDEKAAADWFFLIILRQIIYPFKALKQGAGCPIIK